jgi:hypothetical protein
MDPRIRGVLGFAASIFLDPLTYAGIGPAAKAAKGAAHVAKAAGRKVSMEMAPEYLKQAAKAKGYELLPKAKKAFWMSGTELQEAINKGIDIGGRFFVAGKKAVGKKGLTPVKRVSPGVIPRTAQEVAASKLGKGEEFVQEFMGRFTGSRKPKQGDPLYRVLELEPEGMPGAKAMFAGEELPEEAARIAGTEAGFRAFVNRHIEAIDALSYEEQAKRGIISLFQLNVPGLHTKHIGENLEAVLKRLRVPEGARSAIASEVRGRHVYQALDSARGALRQSRIGHGLIKYFGVTSFADPRAVAWSHKLVDQLHGKLGEFTQNIGEDIVVKQAKLAEHLKKDFSSAFPTLSEKDIDNQLGKLLNDLVANKVVVPEKVQDAGYKAFERRVREYLPEMYTSPHLGGAQQIGDTQFLSEMRALVTESNEYYGRVINLEKAFGLKAPRLLGDTDYVLHMMGDIARKAWRGSPGAQYRKTHGKGSKFVDFLKEDVSFLQREFRTLNEDEVFKLLGSGVEGYETKDLMSLLGGMKFGGADIPRLRSTLRSLLTKGDIDKKAFNAGNKLLRGIGDKAVKRSKARHDALNLAADLHRVKKADGNALIHPWTIKEVNEYVWDQGLPKMGIKPHTVREFFIDEPALQMLARGQRAARVVTDKQFMKALSKFGTKTPPDVKTWKNIPGIERHIPGGEDLFFPNDIHALAEGMTRYLNNVPETLNKFLRANSKVLRHWKAWTLVPFPSYHSRNNIGNLWNNWLAGMGARDMHHYAKADRFFFRLGRYQYYKQQGNMEAANKAIAGIADFTIDGKKYTALDLWKEGQKRNAWNSGMITGDHAFSLRQEISRHGKEMRKSFIGLYPRWRTAEMMDIFGTDSWFINLGFRVAGRFENGAKLAHVMWRLRKGDGLDEAFMSMKKYLFDYSKLSTFEREVLRGHFIPFYTWTRKNLPLQLEHLVTRPEKFARIPKALRGFEDAVGEYGAPADERLMADWMQRAFPARFRTDERGRHRYFLMNSWLPAMDLNMLNPFEWAFTLKSMMSPLPKAFIEQAMNQDLRTGRAIDAFEEDLMGTIMGKGERDRLFGQMLPRRLAYPLKSYIRLIRDADKLFANPDDMEFMEQLANVFVGRVYPSDPSRGYLEFMRQSRELAQGYNYAARSQMLRWKDPKAMKEAARIMELKTERLRGAQTERFR